MSNGSLAGGQHIMRLCHIIQVKGFDGYGFNLHAEKGKPGQYVGKVDEGSPAEAAGLKEGDRIVEVNDVNIANDTHKQVVQKIKAIPNETKLLVVDREADTYFKENNIAIKGTAPNVVYMATPTPGSEENGVNGENNGNCNDVQFQKSNNTSVNQDRDSSSSGATTPSSDFKNSINDSAETHTDFADEAFTPTNNSGDGASKNESLDNIYQYGSLNLNMTAKELRAQLASRKKYDPKKDSMDFKKKFDIVQKL